MPKYLLTWISLIFFAAALAARVFVVPVSPETRVAAQRETFHVTEGTSPSGLSVALIAMPPLAEHERKVMNHRRNLRAWLYSEYGATTLYIESVKPRRTYQVTGPFILSRESTLSWVGTTTLRISGSDQAGTQKVFIIDVNALTLGALFSEQDHETP